ncbi:MAG: nuclease-related domain-containing protein [Ferrimicrobium sp.]
MTIKRMSIRRSDICSVCGVELEPRTIAWWDGDARTVTCVSCHDADITPIQPGVEHSAQEVPSVRTGVAGRSAMEEYQRRHAKREARIDTKFGCLAGVVKFLIDDPQSITAWEKGSIGERKLAAKLQDYLGGHAVLLHDRTVPRTRGNIDHIVVASSGVWVVDAKNYSGLVQQRDVGGFFTVDLRLYVGGRDRSKVLDGLDWQVKAVIKALGTESVPVSSAICFTDAEWGIFAKPFTIRGVLVSDPNALVRRISEPGTLATDVIEEVAGHLSEAFPPKP